MRRLLLTPFAIIGVTCLHGCLDNASAISTGFQLTGATSSQGPSFSQNTTEFQIALNSALGNAVQAVAIIHELGGNSTEAKELGILAEKLFTSDKPGSFSDIEAKLRPNDKLIQKLSKLPKNKRKELVSSLAHLKLAHTCDEIAINRAKGLVSGPKPTAKELVDLDVEQLTSAAIDAPENLMLQIKQLTTWVSTLHDISKRRSIQFPSPAELKAVMGLIVEEQSNRYLNKSKLPEATVKALKDEIQKATI